MRPANFPKPKIWKCCSVHAYTLHQPHHHLDHQLRAMEETTHHNLLRLLGLLLQGLGEKQTGWCPDIRKNQEQNKNNFDTCMSVIYWLKTCNEFCTLMRMNCFLKHRYSQVMWHFRSARVYSMICMYQTLNRAKQSCWDFSLTYLYLTTTIVTTTTTTTTTSKQQWPSSYGP